MKGIHAFWYYISTFYKRLKSFPMNLKFKSFLFGVYFIASINFDASNEILFALYKGKKYTEFIFVDIPK